MSAKRSFDVQHKKAARPPRARPRKASKARSARAPKRPPTLRERREAAGRLKQYAILGACLLVIGGFFYLLWRPDVRISEVKVPDSPLEESVEELARTKMEGTYYAVFPRDSFFLYPEREIEEAVLAAYPAVSRVAVSRLSLTALTIELESRATAFWWCGTPGSVASPCYEADEHGLIFSLADTSGTTTDMLHVHAELDTASTSDTYPLRARVVGTERIPDILRFSRTLESLGTPLTSIAIRGDEADIYTEGGTRITYVIGREREAGESAEAALPKLNLMDGSIEYVDLRFLGKVYLKRVGE